MVRPVVGREGQLWWEGCSAPGALCLAVTRCAGGISVSGDACEIPAPSLAALCAGKVGAGGALGAILPLHQTTLQWDQGALMAFLLPEVLKCILHDTSRGWVVEDSFQILLLSLLSDCVYLVLKELKALTGVFFDGKGSVRCLPTVQRKILAS